MVAGDLARDYNSDLVETIRRNDFTYQDGRVSVHLAKEFGFCYGVERAVDYAYQTRKKFPERTVYLTGEIIHNPQVNARLRTAGIRFLSDPSESIEHVTANDVVILPAFGVTIRATRTPDQFRLHISRHHMWISFERLEERQTIRS